MWKRLGKMVQPVKAWTQCECKLLFKWQCIDLICSYFQLSSVWCYLLFIVYISLDMKRWWKSSGMINWLRQSTFDLKTECFLMHNGRLLLKLKANPMLQMFLGTAKLRRQPAAPWWDLSLRSLTSWRHRFPLSLPSARRQPLKTGRSQINCRVFVCLCGPCVFFAFSLCLRCRCPMPLV